MYWEIGKSKEQRLEGAKTRRRKQRSRLNWKEGDKLGNRGLQKVKGKYEWAVIMVQRAVGEDNVLKGTPVAKI